MNTNYLGLHLLKLSVDQSAPWEHKAAVAQRDALIQKVAVVSIAAANFAALGGILTLVTLYLPLPTQFLVVSPFIVGVLGAIAYMGIPTCGTDKVPSVHWVNAPLLLGKGLAYLFFGPLAFAIRYSDWTNYGDPFVAQKLKQELQEKDFAVIAKWGDRRIENLSRYGYLTREGHDGMLALLERYEPDAKAAAFYKKALIKPEENEDYQQVQTRLQAVQTNWEKIREDIVEKLPNPKTPDVDFRTLRGRLLFYIRKYLLMYPSKDGKV